MEIILENKIMKLRICLGVIHSEILHWCERVRYMLNISLRKFINKIQIADSDDTIAFIYKNKCSVSRFGDGEFYVINGGCNDFQDANLFLQSRLKEILNSNLEGHVICIPYAWKNCHEMKHLVKVFYLRFIVDHYKKIKPFLSLSKKYFDTNFTRFYMDYKDKSQCAERLENIKKIWDGRDVVIVEGKLTRMGFGNDLLNNTKTVKRILGPSKNAFDQYNEIYNTILKTVPKDSLVLIAMGMTATVLAYDLAKNGYQAIDIGHLDVEYEWMRMGATKKVAIPNRFVNEANNIANVQDVMDEKYKEEVIAEVY